MHSLILLSSRRIIHSWSEHHWFVIFWTVIVMEITTITISASIGASFNGAHEVRLLDARRSMKWSTSHDSHARNMIFISRILIVKAQWKFLGCNREFPARHGYVYHQTRHSKLLYLCWVTWRSHVLYELLQ